MSSPESNFSAWLRKADHDLLNIENNLAAKDIPWDTVCFHAQQAAEKLLKAFLVCHGRDLSKTHDLVALLAKCVECDARLADLESDCRKLTTHGVAARYPDDLFEPEEADGRDVVAAAYRVRTKILSLLPKTR
ncbi:MAG: HEPN domain-containing protein [Nitrospira sp.]|nr:HEPN domain-containing protein [Nitrospira sp.]MCP9461452.1 HEPN domain-containing protein [Nitrospira sp.]MCP9474226.1 HEPN domain-containing protein [Nitrospira sp.]